MPSTETDHQPKKPRRKSRHKDKEPSSLFTNTNYITTFVLLISTIVIYDVIFISNLLQDTDVDFESLKSEILKSVHNQSEAVGAVLRVLDKVETEGGLSVVNFYGSTGVGKTFIANIVRRHFAPSGHVVEGPLKSKDITSVIKRLNFRNNLVIFEDLTGADAGDLLVALQEVPKEVNILAICIFSIQETDDFLNHKINYNLIAEIESKFSFSHELARFSEFSSDQAKAWLFQQLSAKDLDPQTQSQVVNSLLESHNVKYHGLKGLALKIGLELQ